MKIKVNLCLKLFLKINKKLYIWMWDNMKILYNQINKKGK